MDLFEETVNNQACGKTCRKAGSFIKKITFFTCDDNPLAQSPEHQDEVIKKVKDLGNIDLQVVGFNKQFDFGKFYSVSFCQFSLYCIGQNNELT